MFDDQIDNRIDNRIDDRIDIWVGRQYGPYEITGVLGRGTVAHCYRAVTLRGEQVGLKVLTPFAEAQSEIRSLFEQEYEVMARLDHRNVLAVHNAGIIGGAHYIEMEIVEGETLADRHGGRNPPSLAAGIAAIQQICCALDHVHEHRIVHRDVKPSNIMMEPGPDGDDRAVLFDFGLAHDLDGPPSPPGRVYGSPMYLSPEQALAKPVDARTDIYGLGATLYVLAVGSAPFYGERNDLLHAHVRIPPPDPAERGVPPELSEIILAAMAKSPQDRFASGADFAAALAGVEIPAHHNERRRGLLRRLTSRATNPAG